MKNIYRKINSKKYCLGDLVRVLNAVAKTPEEATAALMDLFASGKLRIVQKGKPKRVRLALS
ncbi:MAG: hypothetical protein N2035_00385 [Chthoniobacterales bacterium]|nr:hypothetical protein [Chthoniobacterales bacterium]MCX7712115.1 hypothetical protein [Chthoniobacterales bacterium]